MTESEPAGRSMRLPDQVEYGPDDPASAPPPAPWNDVDQRLAEARDFWLVAVRPSGSPHAVAIWGVWDGAQLWFTMSPRTWTARHLARWPQALAHLPDPADAIVIEGQVDQRAPASVPEAVVDRYEAVSGWRLDPADPNMPYFALRAATVRSWRSGDLRGTATRWDLSG